MALNHKNLKRGIYTSPQSGDTELERYIIENQEDLNAFLKAFPMVKQLPKQFDMVGNWKRSLSEGRIIIATDENYHSGLPTYCFENTTGSTHISSFNRVRLIQ
ncbi:hypothetical protein [Flavobacterium sp.]|uniref:hypothetical protein n=1 Tax=Flavobacterium sp. TaxID=239 RepID=UPI002626E76C|nr:hypothetical protein [Flavobacterium sp.]